MTNFGYQPKCRRISLEKLIITPSGLFEPLCQSCTQVNCGNPIEPKNVSVYGVNKNWRMYVNHGNPLAVIECEAYVSKKEESKPKTS